MVTAPRARLRSTVVGAGVLTLLVACAAGASPADAPGGTVVAPAAPQEAAATEGAAAPGTRPPTGAEGGTGAAPTAQGPFVVRTGHLELEVDDVPAALDTARSAVADLGGYVAGSEETSDGDRVLATIVYRVPVERWEELLAALRASAGRVIAERTEAAEVTHQVVDIDARIVNLRASESALQAIMDRAGTIEDVLEVQTELTGVRGEIERLTAQRRALADSAAYATLTVTWSTPVVAVSAASAGWDPAVEVDRALATTVGAGQALGSLAIWLLLVAVPVFVPLGLLLYVGARLGRRWLASRSPRPPDPLWGPGGGG